MKHKFTILLGAFIVLAASVLPTTGVSAIGGISVTGGSVQAGSNITVQVRGNTGGQNAATVELYLQYDTSKLQYVSNSRSGSHFNVGPGYANSGNQVSGSAWNTSFATINNSNVFIASITFKALASSGSTTISLQPGTDLAADGPIGASLTNGTVSFTPVPTPTTPTPAPTTPTPTPTTPTPSSPSTPTPSTPSTPKPSSPSPTSPGTPSTPGKEEAPADDIATPIDESVVVSTIKIGFFDKNHKPLANKKVTLHSTPQTATTDSKGYATFKNVPAGEHKAEYKDGSKTYTATLTITDDSSRSVVYNFVQTSFPWWGWVLIALAVIGIAGAGAYTYLFLRKRKAAQLEHYTPMPLPGSVSTPDEPTDYFSRPSDPIESETAPSSAEQLQTPPEAPSVPPATPTEPEDKPNQFPEFK